MYLLATPSLMQLILFRWPSFFFDTRVMGQRSIMIKRWKSCKEKGHERREIFNNKDGFQSRNED